jgi:hypothetical protein
MYDRILSLLPIIILAIAVVLPLSSALDGILGPAVYLPVKSIQFHMSAALLGLSSILLILNLLLTRHPFYEYWLTAMIGGVVGAVYLL